MLNCEKGMRNFIKIQKIKLSGKVALKADTKEGVVG